MVKEFVAVNGTVSSSPTILTLESSFVPHGIAVDSTGNVYVSDFSNNEVKEILAVNGSIPASPTIVTLGNGFCGTADLALDSTGDIFVADYCNAAIFELPAVNGAVQPGTTQVNVAGGLPGVEGVAVSSYGTIYAGTASSATIPAFIPPVGSFGSINVGSTSSIPPLQVVFDSGGTLGPVSALTAGAAGMDFANATSSTCVANTTYTTGQTCTVNVTFTPKFAGLRNGAVELNDANGNGIATAYLQGTGVGPQLSFSPGTQTTLGSSFSFAQGIAVDGTGNAYVIDKINNLGNVQEIMAVNGHIPANPTVRTLVGGLDCPSGPALDAAGNVYFVDICFHTVNEIQAANGGIPSSATVRTLTSQFVEPEGIAVDGHGNIYVSDASNNSVSEILAVNGSIPASPTITTLASGFRELDGIAVDGNGNVYVSDDTSREVFEIHAVNGTIPTSPLITSLGSGFVIPRGIAVDAVGNVYVAEYYYNTVYKILAVNGTIPASPTIQSIGTELSAASGVAVDASSNVFVADYGDARVVELDYADPPSLTFDSTPVGSTSADSPQTVTLTNIGNTDLTFPIPASGNNPDIATNFTLDDNVSSACPVIGSGSSQPSTLAAGSSCVLSIGFAPTAAGSLSGALAVTDNNLNAGAPGYVTQNISLSGTATPAAPTISWSIPGAITYGTALGAAQLNATANVPGTFSYSPGAGAVLSAGTQTLTVTFTPTDTTNYTTVTATVSWTVNKATPTISWLAPAPITYGTALSTSQLDATANVPGTFVYSPAAGTVLQVGTSSLNVVFTPNDTIDYTTVDDTVTLLVNPVPGFTLTTTTPAISLVSGTSTSAAILVNATGGFSGTVSLAVSGLPKGVTATFSPNPTTSTSSIFLSASGGAARSSSSVTITGTSGSLVQTTTISLTVYHK
jgi:sugar lactone lactonase YvrE